jgi:hypothetical protein
MYLNRKWLNTAAKKTEGIDIELTIFLNTGNTAINRDTWTIHSRYNIIMNDVITGDGQTIISGISKAPC